MGTMNIAEEGVSLLGASGHVHGEDDSKPAVKPLQAMRLELEDGVLDNIVRTARSGGKGVHLSFGRTITLDYGNRSKQLSATVEHTPTEVYSYTDGNSHRMVFAALQSHRLAMKKAQEDTMGADVALAKLQSQLASAEREKQARQIQLAGNNLGLQPAVSRRGAAKTSNSLSTMKRTTTAQRRPNSAVHSLANSPSLGAASSPHQLVAVTSEPPIEDAKAQRAKAIRTPLIHFLAVRPVSQKYLVQTLHCDEDDCVEVLMKVGKPYRLDPDKWDLSDKAFKELDVWHFQYKTADDRQLAIDRAISSFDRSRLPRSHPLWQKLLPFHERGKGKVLSNLNLNDPNAQRVTTPRIHVQSTEDTAAARQTPGNDSDARQDRLAPNGAEPMARSKSGNSLKKVKAIETNVRSKTPLSKKPTKTSQTTQPRARPQDKPTATKKGAKKGATSHVVAKSSEFVHDSDEEDDEDMLDAPALKPKPSTPKVASAAAKKAPATQSASDSKTSSAPAKRHFSPELASSSRAKPLEASAKRQIANTQVGKDNKTPTAPPVKAAEKRPPVSSTSISGSKPASSDSGNAFISVSKTLSRQRTTSSPHKPSPLGSSPPTNASDLDNDSRPLSSSSSTPLNGHSEARKSSNGTEIAEVATNGLHNGPSLKRKAPADEGDAELLTNGASFTNCNTLTNGHPINAKRYKASPISPPTSESSTESSTEAKRRQALEQAQRFKTFWVKYQRLYGEVSTLPKDAPNKKFDELMKMHERLTVMKAEIARATLQRG